MSRRGQLEQDLLAVLGEAGLSQLVTAYGGQRLRVHSRPQPGSPLAKRLGPGLYAALQAAFRGEELDIPTLRYQEHQARRARVRALAAQGLTANRIAATEGLSLRRVREILASRDAPAPPAAAGAAQLPLW